MYVLVVRSVYHALSVKRCLHVCVGMRVEGALRYAYSKLIFCIVFI